MGPGVSETTFLAKKKEKEHRGEKLHEVRNFDGAVFRKIYTRSGINSILKTIFYTRTGIFNPKRAYLYPKGYKTA